MAANPADAGASGIAASAAGVGTGGPEYPMDDVRSIFTILGMIINRRDGMINAHNLTSMDDFDYIRVDDAKSFFKVWN